MLIAKDLCLVNYMGIGLYIHIPFCLKKCNYCDFTSYIFNPAMVKAYLAALDKEMALYSSSLPPEEKQLETIYIGGGTPTCLRANELYEVLKACRYYFTWLPEIEVTVEANPGTVDLEKFAILRQAGINRLSIGVQTDSDNLLQVLGRQHTFEQAVEAVRLARQAGFGNINLDLIFGIPGQTLTSWRECLAKTVNLSPQHISVYNLQLEEGIPLWEKIKSGQLKTCPEETELAMYEQAIEFLKGNNYLQYEISNFAQTGYQCRHNLRYWRNISYLGLGLSAHSYLPRRRFNNTDNINTYLNCLTEGKLPVSRVEFISKPVEMQETVFLGLRLMQGLDLTTFFVRFGCCIEDVFTAQLKNLLHLGLVEINGSSLRLTKKGLPVANFVFREFV